ncbi:MAG TPA: glycosyltransferase family 4 protein [Candidatus Paceibacterota bacterium]|nr:glycosyltransferase family 4 protein [Candidatus Paceibacterota bacterium]
MRILLATGLYPPDVGGPATYAKLFEEHLPSRGIRVDVLPFGAVRHLPRFLRHTVYFLWLCWLARPADALFAQDTVSVGLPAALAAFLLRKRFVVRVPGDYAWEQARQRWGITDTIDVFQTRRYRLRTEAVRRVQRFVVRRADRVIVPSIYFRTVVLTWGVLSERLVVIYNGIGEEESRRPRGPIAHPCMVSIGRLVPWKGFGLLMRVLTRMPAWHLVIVGDGPERASLEALAQTEGVRERVTFTGEIPRAEVLGWCEATDAFVLNSSFESFSFQIAEAMTVGASIIATNIGSIPELIENGKEGILLAPNDEAGFLAALESVYADKDAWRMRRAAAREKSKYFSIDRTLDSVSALLTAL